VGNAVIDDGAAIERSVPKMRKRKVSFYSTARARNAQFYQIRIGIRM
jgi:hypothetical protein